MYVSIKCIVFIYKVGVTIYYWKIIRRWCLLIFAT